MKVRVTLLREKPDKQWTGRPPRSLEALSEFYTRCGGQFVWEGYKFDVNEEAMVTLCEHSELTERLHMYRNNLS